MFVFIQQQTAVSDRQFLRWMIPHHSGAPLMCQNASLQNAEIRKLCETIFSSQQQEIEQMKSSCGNCNESWRLRSRVNSHAATNAFAGVSLATWLLRQRR